MLLAWGLHFTFLLAFRLEIVSFKAPLRCDLCSVTLPPCSCLHHTLYAFKTVRGADRYCHGLPSTSSLHSISQRRNWGQEDIPVVSGWPRIQACTACQPSYQLSCLFSSLLSHLTCCHPGTPSHSDSSRYTIMLPGCQSHQAQAPL